MLAYFPHIPKTGGQTLYRGFYEAFGRKSSLLVHNPKFGGDVDVSQFVELEEERFKGIKAVIGHLPVKQFLANAYMRNLFENGKVKTFTSVRDPIKRIVSLWNYVQVHPKVSFSTEATRKGPKSFLVNYVANFQLNFLQLDTCPELSERIDLLPIEGSIPGLRQFFATTFNLKVSELERKNKISSWTDRDDLFSVDDIPPDTYESLLEKHSLDFELYNSALSRFGNQAHE